MGWEDLGAPVSLCLIFARKNRFLNLAPISPCTHKNIYRYKPKKELLRHTFCNFSVVLYPFAVTSFSEYLDKNIMEKHCKVVFEEGRTGMLISASRNDCGGGYDRWAQNFSLHNFFISFFQFSFWKCFGLKLSCLCSADIFYANFGPSEITARSCDLSDSIITRIGTKKLNNTEQTQKQ